jgi:hypothetical protein
MDCPFHQQKFGDLMGAIAKVPQFGIVKLFGHIWSMINVKNGDLLGFNGI